MSFSYFYDIMLTNFKAGLTKREYNKLKREAKKLADTLKKDPENAEAYMKLKRIYLVLENYALN